MSLKNNIEDLKRIVHNGNILSSEEERYCYSQDSTNLCNSVTLPDVVVFVQTIEEVQNILKYANIHKIPVVSRGAGTNMVGACACNNGGIVLNFSKMNKILDFQPDNMTMRVQPGVVVGDIKKLAESQGLFYPPDPSNFAVSTIGGSIAQSSGGAMAFKYGTTKDYILSLTVVLADGTIMKLGSGNIKDAVGYHLNQLIVGSEGSLAVVVEAELKLIPKPEASSLVVAYFDSIDDAIAGVNGIIKERVFPATLDFMDKNAINTVESFLPCGLNIKRECLLFIEVDGFESSLKTQTERVEKALSEANCKEISVISEQQAKDKYWTARRASFAAAAKLGADVVTDDLIVPRINLSPMVNGCKEICAKYNLKTCIVGHIGDGNIHPQITLNLENDTEFKAYMSAKSEIYNLVLSLGGAISSEHGVGIEKVNYMSQSVDNNALDYMKKLKLLFDPNNILNPGKIFKL